MKIKKGIESFLVAIIAGLCFFYSEVQAQQNENEAIGYDKYEAKIFVQQLDELGYFKYADEADIDSLKSTMINEFNPKGHFTSIWYDDSNTLNDFRYYGCDGEQIFEQDGIISLIKDLEPVFDKMNFKCVVTNHVEEWDYKYDWLNHKITINGTEYIIFRNFKGYGWVEAPFRIAQILNTELQKQNIDEQIYLIYGGNDGSCALLSYAQYQLIYKIFKNSRWRPLEIYEWAKESRLDVKKFDYWNK